jgi:hypothetical protein
MPGIFEVAERSNDMEPRRINRQNISWNLNVLDLGTFVCLVFILLGILNQHTGNTFDLAWPIFDYYFFIL